MEGATSGRDDVPLLNPSILQPMNPGAANLGPQNQNTRLEQCAAAARFPGTKRGQDFIDGRNWGVGRRDNKPVL